MRVFITGGAGFIGSHTCVALLQAGYDIVVADNLSNAKLEAVHRITQITGKAFPFYQVDIRDRAGLEQIFSAYDIDAVIHFAGLKAVGESVRKPLEYYQNNVAGTLVLCEVMRQFGCKKMVFSSSATVYGPQNPIPYREEFPTGPVNPYGFTKLMVEQILTDLGHSDPEWSISLLRYFNPIGAHESGLIGEDPNGIPNNLLPYICQVAVGKLEKLHVFGNDYDTPDGTGIRDYVHVCDLAEGHLKALEYVSGHTGVDAVNLGTGRGCSVLEVVAAYERACGKPIPYVVDPRRPGDIGEYYADPSKAKAVFGWEAKRSLDDMCRDSWNFTQNNPAGL